jgi:NAD(P)-dependent dehydrogenase (short-subunit alcohol dehydrogenase family)
MIDYLGKFSLVGKIAFVMGGLGLIGREVCNALVTAGAKTIILDLKKDQGLKFEKELSHENYDAKFIHFDCADMDRLEKNFANLLNDFDSPDIFINCSYPRTPEWRKSSFKDVTLTSFRKNVDIHMNSHAWLARMAAEAMFKGDKGGSIIQFGSIYGIVGQDLSVYEGTEMQENMTYSAIKGGITNLTHQMAAYYGQFNIRINTIVPGGLAGHVVGKKGGQDPLFVKQYSEKTPQRRLGKTEEVASTVLFLASDAASYINGGTILVDGGYTII